MKFLKVKFYHDVPVSMKPSGIPDMWPAESSIWEGEEIDEPYHILSEAEYTAHIAEYKHEYDAFEQGQLPTMEEKLAQKIDAVAEQGTRIAREGRNRIGARNLLLGKTEAQIMAVVFDFNPVKAALEGGALKTGQGVLASLVQKYPEYKAEFDYINNEINKVLGG